MSDWSSSSADEQFSHLGTVVLSSPASVITFSGLDTSNVLFRLILYGIQDVTNGVAGLRVNDLSTTIYRRQIVEGHDATETGIRGTSSLIDINSFGNLDAEAAYLFECELYHPTAVLNGEFFASSIYLDHTDALLHLELKAGQIDETTLYSRIDLVTAAGNFDTGTRVVLEGGP